MINAPCKDCQDRQMGCHGKCEKYQTFRAARTVENEYQHMLKASTKGDKTWFEKEYRRKVRSRR